MDDVIRFYQGLPFPLAVECAYDECGRLEYVGETTAKNQKKFNEPVWRIKKIIYLEGECKEDMRRMRWANSSHEATFCWNKKGDYSY